MIDNNCFEKIGMFISAKGLKKMETFSNTDAFAVVYAKDTKSQELNYISTTRVIKDTNNPQWADHILINYYFEVVQEVTIKIYHQCGNLPTNQLQGHKYCGEVTFTLSSLMCSRGHSVELNLTGGPSGAESVANTRDVFIGTFSGTKLAKMNGIFFGHSDPFLNFYTMYEGTGGTSWGLVFKTDVIHNTNAPVWSNIRIPMLTLCNGDIDRPIKIEIMDWEGNGKHQYMGELPTSVRNLITCATPMSVKNVKKDKVQGTVAVTNASIEANPTLTDFIAGGLEISLIVAIDFTGSNGDPVLHDSLHHIHPNGQFNQYQQAIATVGRVVEAYDTDKKFPVYGFGAKLRKPDGQQTPVQHCFPVYGGGAMAEGVDGILRAYMQCLNNVVLSGPTLFAPLIEASTAVAEAFNCSQEQQKYAVLLIMTDGEINDMDNTIQAIIRASIKPMSIIIVGVGSADFTNMIVLDGDKKILQFGGVRAARDIVQFVAFKDYLVKGTMTLAQDVLAEVPGQLLQYMKARGIVPKRPQAASLSAVSSDTAAAPSSPQHLPL